MAKQTNTPSKLKVKAKKNNKGVHSKSKNSRSKKAKNYKKLYVGQG
jgi:hypothetical protein